jgi:hypothetical protein
MKNWKGWGRKRPWPTLEYYTGIFVEKLSKTTKNLSHHSRRAGRDSNRAPLKYKSEALPIESTCLVSDDTEARNTDKIHFPQPNAAYRYYLNI